MGSWIRPLAWLCALVLAGGLAACGGGGGPASQLPSGTADARNGTYQMYAADALLYALTLDFDARTWRVVGNGVDSTGTFRASGSEFTFDPTGAVPAQNNARFTAGDDTVSGGFRFAGGVVPFVAARSFVTTIGGAAGAYKFLTRTVDPATFAPDNFIFTGEIAAPNILRTCNDNTLLTIAACPAASVINGTVTVSGDQFTANVPGGSFSFRVAQVGSERVFLRASASTGTSRRFWVGIDQAATFADATFTGVNSAQQSSRTTFAGTTMTSSFVSEANVPSTRTGAVANAGVPGLQGITTAADGNFFALRTGTLGFVFAARANPVHPGEVEIGRR